MEIMVEVRFEMSLNPQDDRVGDHCVIYKKPLLDRMLSQLNAPPPPPTLTCFFKKKDLF
jgi:hypothetical protein